MISLPEAHPAPEPTSVAAEASTIRSPLSGQHRYWIFAITCPFAISAKAGQERTLDRFEKLPDHAKLPLALEEVAIRLNPTQGLAGMNKNTRLGIRLRDLMAQRPKLVPVLADHEQRMDSVKWALYRVQRAIKGEKSFARRISAERVGSRAKMEDALAQASGVIEELAGIQRAVVTRRDDFYPCTEDFYVPAPWVTDEKMRSGFWESWTEAGGRTA